MQAQQFQILGFFFAQSARHQANLNAYIQINPILENVFVIFDSIDPASSTGIFYKK